MSRKRHATPIKSTQRGIFSARVLNLLSTLTRLQIVLLSAAACSLVLAFTSSLGTPAENNQLSDGDTFQNSTANNRFSRPLDLNQAKRNLQHETMEAVEEPDRAGDPEASHFTAKLDTNTPLQAGPTDIESTIESTTAALAPPVHKNYTLKNGDNLSTIFNKMGLSAKEVYRITNSGDEGKALTRMYPGEALTFVFNGDDSLQQIIRKKSALESVYFTPTTDSYKTELITRTPEVRQVHRSGTVTHSLALAANRSGLSATTTMNMANIFGGVIDFVYDVRGGDKFTVVYEELYLDDEKIDEGNIIAAQYVNRGNAYNAFRYEEDNGEVGYYNEEGESMRKAFLRAPLDFTRVSSGFNLKRLHPVTKKVKPHRGTDYAAPTGTPVFSVGEGRVIASGYSNANGKYVFVKHGEAYTTKYLHLSRRTVKSGQRVKQGQIIGHVGCTGLCTGPHLHYEFLVNGVHRNPRTIVNKLPKAKRLAKSELPAFTLATAESQEVLKHFSTQFELASN